MANLSGVRVLLYDLETSPLMGTTWGLYEQNMVWVEQEWQILMFAYKWLGERQTHVVSQHDFKGWKPGKLDDTKVIQKLYGLFNEADIIVAHNGDQFDQKKSMARFIYHGYPPPSPYQQIDTKKIAKRYFNFTSNKLDDLGEYLGLGRKLKTDKELWRGCMRGDLKAWNYMAKYNKQDVILLEKIYLKLLPYTQNHPNMANITGRPESCPKCLAEEGFQARGFRITKTAKYRRWQCKACGCYVSNRAKTPDPGPMYV